MVFVSRSSRYKPKKKDELRRNATRLESGGGGEPLYETWSIHKSFQDTWFWRQPFFGLGLYSTQNLPLIAPISRQRLEALGMLDASRDARLSQGAQIMSRA